MSESAAHRVVVFRTGQLGDTLCSLPAIEAISRSRPGSELILLTNPTPRSEAVSAYDLLGPTGLFRRVFYSPKPGPGGWAGLLRLAAALRGLRAAELFYLAPFPRTSFQIARDRFFLRALCGIPRLHGAEPPALRHGARDAAGRLRRFPQETTRLLGILAKAGVAVPPAGGVRFALPIGEPHRRAVHARWAQTHWPSDARVLAFVPGSKMQAKQWPRERFAELGDRLLSAHPSLRLALLGGPGETELCSDLCRRWGDRAFSFAGRLSVLESAELLRRCLLYVGNDTGLMHLAAAVGVRCVAIFSARDHPGSWEPYGEGHVVLRREVPCAGCLLEVCERMKKICLTGIGVEEVERAVAPLLPAA